MRIGFDISQTGTQKAGCGFVADSLIRALSEIDFTNEYFLYPNFGNHFWDPKANENTTRIHMPNFSNRLFLATSFNQSMNQWNNFPADGEYRLGNPDIIHSNNFYFPKSVKNARVIYTLYDMSSVDCPEMTTERNFRGCFDGLFHASVYADFIISISKHTRNRFLKTFPHFPEERIKVIYPGNRFDFKDRSGNNTDPVSGLTSNQFWLTVGTLEPRKNIRRLLKAFKQASGQINTNYPLVLAGGQGWLEDDLKDFINGLGLTDTVIILGYVPDDKLLWLYKNCYAFIYPSLYEGFGLPVLEAMSMGAAVITSDITSIPEVTGSSACLIDPKSKENISRAIQKLEEDDDYREQLKKASLKQSLIFSWENCAKEVLDVYNKISHLPKRGNISFSQIYISKIGSMVPWLKNNPVVSRIVQLFHNR